jgi:hypothetical protein
MSETVKTLDGTLDDPFLRDPSYQIPTHPLLKRRNASETMTYFAAIALLIFVVSPVLVPLVITGVHAFLNWRRTSEPFQPVIKPERLATA